MIALVVVAFGHDLSTLISRSTIQISRRKARKQYVESAMSGFKPYCLPVLHWDDKLRPESFGLGEVDRMPVYVSGEGMEKPFDVPKLRGGGTAQNIVKSVFMLLKQWGVEENIQASSFVTTSVITGCVQGSRGMY